jgi:formylglycine-generating enzyme required for sulfatase activity
MADQTRVFVSHHHSIEEDAFTARLVDDLRRAGALTWVDVAEIHAGDFMERINTALASTDWVVVVFTPASLRSLPVRTEVNAALNLVWQGRMRGVIPVVAQQCELAEIPPTWTTLQRYDATKDCQGAFTGLLNALGLPQPSPSRQALKRTESAQRVQPTAIPNVMPSVMPTALHDLGFHCFVVGAIEYILPPLCSVPSGAFLMGSQTARAYDAQRNEMPQSTVQVGDFKIGQHPVTVAEYAYAVRAKAVREPPEVGGFTWPMRLRRLDHPVVCISWHDALEYTRWLADMTGQGWRLLTEAEWEKAARGTDGRIYPWDDDFDNTKCNTRVSGVGTTMPVGTYPGGASPYGVQDMAGNVWEWTSTLMKPYPYKATDGREDVNSPGNRILRGGSWGANRGGVRAAYRDFNYSPDQYYDILGFRLAWSAAGS